MLEKQLDKEYIRELTNVQIFTHIAIVTDLGKITQNSFVVNKCRRFEKGKWHFIGKFWLFVFTIFNLIEFFDGRKYYCIKIFGFTQICWNQK